MFISNCNKSASSSPTSTFQTHIQQPLQHFHLAPQIQLTQNRISLFPSYYPQTCFSYCIFPSTMFLISNTIIYLINQASNHPKHPSHSSSPLCPTVNHQILIISPVKYFCLVPFQSNPLYSTNLPVPSYQLPSK